MADIILTTIQAVPFVIANIVIWPFVFRLAKSELTQLWRG